MDPKYLAPRFNGSNPVVQAIPKIANLSVDAFVTDFIRPQRPVILQGWAQQWPAFSKWSFEYFATRYADVPVRAGVNLTEGGLLSLPVDEYVHDMSMREFVALIQSPQRTKPCYLYEMQTSRFPGASDDVAFPAALKSEHGYSSSIASNLWIGSGGTKLTFHFDLTDNFLAQIAGEKFVRLAAPDQSRMMYPTLRQFTESAVDADRFDPRLHPDFRSVTLYENSLEPGEILYIPQFWWHEIRALNPSISVNDWFGPKSTSALVRLLLSLGVRHATAAVGQALKYKVFKRQHSQFNLYSGNTSGELIVDELRSSLRSAASEQSEDADAPSGLAQNDVIVPGSIQTVVGPLEGVPSLYVYCKGKGNHLVFGVETSAYFDALKTHSRFKAGDSVHWLQPQPFSWEEIQGALQALLDSGFIKLEAAAA